VLAQALPAGHVVHAAPPRLYVPAAHATGSDEGDKTCVPAGADVQLDEPAVEYVLAAQATAAAAPPAQDVPAAHVAHAVRVPDVVAVVPLGQASGPVVGSGQ
jgi:hypothetical protein